MPIQRDEVGAWLAEVPKHFARTGVIDPKFHRWLLDEFDRRIQADYRLDSTVTPQEARIMVDRAMEFLQECRRFLGA